jgi:hypothetical protein
LTVAGTHSGLEMGREFTPIRFIWVVALLLVLTLGLKWVASSRESVSIEPEQVAAQKVAEFLVRRLFNVVGPKQVVFGMQLIDATAGACHMRVAVSASRGWHRDLIGTLASPTDQKFVVFGGAMYPEQPMWRTVPDFLWFKLLNKLGFNVQPTPVITVLAGPNCDAERLPWNELD